MEITRAKVEHLLKVGIWQEMTKGNLGLEWKHIYMCGSNVVAFADNEEELTELIKTSDAPLFPKTIYRPPHVSRREYFGGSECTYSEYSTDGNDRENSDGNDDKSTHGQYLLLSSATCIMPCIVDSSPVETYDFSPFELAYVTSAQCRKQMLTLLMAVKRLRYYIPREMRPFIYDYLFRTSNRGFHLAH